MSFVPLLGVYFHRKSEEIDPTGEENIYSIHNLCHMEEMEKITELYSLKTVQFWRVLYSCEFDSKLFLFTHLFVESSPISMHSGEGDLLATTKDSVHNFLVP